MRFLIVSYKHGLLPLALRLRNEGNEVDVVVWKKRYEACWGDKLHPTLRGSAGEINERTLEGLLEAARETNAAVLSDVPPTTGAHRMLSQLPNRYLYETVGEEVGQSDICLGFWFDGEAPSGAHLIVYDLGAWPGGLGPAIPAGATIIYPSPQTDLSFLEEMTHPITDQLKAADFRGLVNVGMRRNHQGMPELVGIEAGWPSLHLDGWLSALSNTTGVFEGQPPIPEAKFTTVLPVSVPPWPSYGNQQAKKVQIGGLPPALVGKFFWYDMEPHEASRELWTAGTDGLVGVARGSGSWPEAARLKAVGLAQKIQLPEKQYRPDVGGKVGMVLAQLEESFGLVL